jgi:hypothetical protein
MHKKSQGRQGKHASFPGDNTAATTDNTAELGPKEPHNTPKPLPHTWYLQQLVHVPQYCFCGPGQHWANGQVRQLAGLSTGPHLV